MTQSSTIGAGHPQPTDGRAADTTASGSVQLSFNPMHPSMELPPEQLIRLLGVETKKTRKARHAHEAKHAQSNRPEKKVESRDPNPSPRGTQPAMRSDQTGFGTRRAGLRALALIATLLTVIGIGAYLFLSGSPSQHAGTGDTQQQATDGAPELLRHQNPATMVARPESSAESRTNRKTTTTPRNGVYEQAAIDAELLRLRHEAEQRFERRTAEQQHYGDTAPENSDVSKLPTATANSGPGTGITEVSLTVNEQKNIMPETAPAPVPSSIPEAYNPDTE